MISNLFVGAEVAKKIWVPDTFFANGKCAEIVFTIKICQNYQSFSILKSVIDRFVSEWTMSIGHFSIAPLAYNINRAF